MKRAIVLIVAILAGALAGCNGAGGNAGPPSADELFVYPPPPGKPRYQFLASFDSAETLVQRKSGGTFADWIAGEEDPRTAQAAPGQMSSPFAIDIHQGSLYVCDVGNPKLRVYNFADRSYKEIGAGRQLVRPVGVRVAADGTKYVCDAGLRRVVVFDASDRFVKHMGDPKTCSPIDILLHNGQLYVVDFAGGEVEVWDTDGKLLRTIATKGNRPENLQEPVSIDIDSKGQLYVSDRLAAQVKVYNTDGQFLRTLGAPGDTPGHFARPKHVRVDSADRVYVCGSERDTVQVFSPEGQLLLVMHNQSETPQQMIQPTGLAIDTSSMPYFSKYVADKFQPQFLVFVANQLGAHHNKITVLAYVEEK